MLTDIAGIRVGHWTDTEARTGCTVGLLPEGTVASAEVRGGAPASRELALLAPERTVQRVDAVLLTGGSAFGLAAADGVMRYCEEHGVGVRTAGGVVPIVPAMGLYDLSVGTPAHPGPADGYAACRAASSGPVELGAVGAGAGATVSNWRGATAARPGGLVGRTVRSGQTIVSALVAVNAFGDIDADGSGAIRAVVEMDRGRGVLDATRLLANTTIGIVATNAQLDKTQCLVMAQGAHDGLSRSLVPGHTRVDGDAFVAVATGGTVAAGGAHATTDVVRLLTVAAVEQAVRSLG